MSNQSDFEVRSIFGCELGCMYPPATFLDPKKVTSLWMEFYNIGIVHIGSIDPTDDFEYMMLNGSWD